jgi:transposase InsO family protein
MTVRKMRGSPNLLVVPFAHLLIEVLRRPRESRPVHRVGVRPAAARSRTARVDRHTWTTREQLANAVFANLKGFYNPRRRHSALGYLSPADYETAWRRQQLAPAA